MYFLVDNMTTARLGGELRSEFLERGEFVRLISQMPETYKVALLLSLETGLRISDVLGLTFSQVLWSAPVRERKTGKTVVLDVPAYLKASLWGWWLDRQRELVFESKKAPGRPVSRSTVYRWVRRVAQAERPMYRPTRPGKSLLWRGSGRAGAWSRCRKPCGMTGRKQRPCMR